MVTKEDENKDRNPFLWIDIIVYLIQFIIGLMFCVFTTSPVYFFMHLFYKFELGSFWIFTKWDLCLLVVSNIIFWLKIYSDNKTLKG